MRARIIDGLIWLAQRRRLPGFLREYALLAAYRLDYPEGLYPEDFQGFTPGQDP